jgi:hypothetical protein
MDEEEYYHFDEILPFTNGIETVPVTNNDERNYLYSDHKEGVWVQRIKIKEE